MSTRNKYRLIRSIIIKAINLYFFLRERKIHREYLRYDLPACNILSCALLRKFASCFSTVLGRAAQSAGRASENTEKPFDEEIYKR